MSKIFFNYRRDDSAAYAGRLYDRLANHFGRDHIFMDIDQIAPGEDFIEVVQEKLKSVQIAVVLIGKHWLDITDDSGQRRLDNPDDFMRVEIAALLERKIRVIPVLVGGAIVPKSSQLPECLALLVRCNAYEISDKRFHADVDKLIQVLEKIIDAQMPPPSVEPPKQSNFLFIFATIGILLAVVGLFSYFSWTAKDTSTNLAQPTVSQSDELIAKQSEVEQPSASRLPFESEMVLIPHGKFLMGTFKNEPAEWDKESPQHEVTIDYTFEISKYEITFDEYDHFAKSTQRNLPKDEGWGRGNRPVINVTFNDAYEYVLWLSQQTGKKYRLLTEAEWEYAAWAGTQTAYWWGDGIGINNANCSGCSSHWDNRQTAQVGSFKPNAFGLFDTAGNGMEWTQDCWHDNYPGAPTDGSAWKETDGGNCTRRVFRGGSGFDEPKYLRSASRDYFLISNVDFGLGFRIARTL